MIKKAKTRDKLQFGDFQTPPHLAKEVCSLLSRLGIKPASIIEPNCGTGSFVVATMEFFPDAKKILAFDINETCVKKSQDAVRKAGRHTTDVQITRADFFRVDWDTITHSLQQPLLILGNPPWVTNSVLGTIKSSNLPVKSNFEQRRGIDAITGKSNFDISEWMLSREIEWITGRQAVLAMLCKTTVARKVLRRAWKKGLHFNNADVYLIDAQKHFGVAVDAGLLVVTGSPKDKTCDCRVHRSLPGQEVSSLFGYRQNTLVANLSLFEQHKNLWGLDGYKWRSGIKHDCAKVLELIPENSRYRNTLGQHVLLEPDYLYPMLKSSDLARPGQPKPIRWMLVTQHHIGEDTSLIRRISPKTWDYLTRHEDYFARRASTVYRNRSRFAIFGVGDYSFADWKVGISGLYKKLDFKVVGPYMNKPVVLDDTCYFIACISQSEAYTLAELLNSDVAREFLSAFIFWDEKRPITLSILKRLSIRALAKKLHMENRLKEYLTHRQSHHNQMLLWK